jgi:hypothetical protein
MAHSAPVPRNSTPSRQNPVPPIAGTPQQAPPAPPSVEQYGSAAVRAMQTLRSNECPIDVRVDLVTQLLRDISLQRLNPKDSKLILQGLVEAVRNGHIPNESVNVIANVTLGEIQSWPERDRSIVLRDFLVAIADVGHSDLLRSAVTVSTIRLLEGFPEPSVESFADLSLWLGYSLVRNRIPTPLRDGVVRVCFAGMRNTGISKEVRGKIAWVLSTLCDVTEFPYLPVEEILQFSDCPEVPEQLREQTRNNLNRRALMSVGLF